MATTAASAASNADSTNDLDQLKLVLLQCQSKMRKLETPQNELRQICDAVRHAVQTERMASDEEFRKFVHQELAIGLMQKMAKTMSFDQEVSGSID